MIVARASNRVTFAAMSARGFFPFFALALGRIVLVVGRYDPAHKLPPARNPSLDLFSRSIAFAGRIVVNPTANLKKPVSVQIVGFPKRAKQIIFQNAFQK